MAEGVIPLNGHGHRDWEAMKDKEVLGIARRIIEENGVKTKMGLDKADHGLYKVLYKRKLLGEVKFKEKRRMWGTDEEVLDFGKKFIEEKGIKSQKELVKADSGLHAILSKRKLLGEVKFKEKRRMWGTDEEVLGIARRIIEENEVKNRRGLAKVDYGLYQILRNRKLLDKMEFRERRQIRDWGTDREVLETARRFIEKNEIRNRHGLEKADRGLYTVLRRRDLLDQVFASIDHDKHKKAVQGVLDAMDSFGDDR